MRTAYDYFYKLKTIPKFIFLLLFVLGFNIAIQAQESGKIIGTVSDKLSGDPLPGANVLLEGTSLGAASTLEGGYIIRQVAPGDYNMVVKYIGYKETKIPVTVESGKTVQVNVELEYVTIEGEEVLVTSQASGQIEAINQQLSSNTIKNVVSSEQIQEIPDVNVAESVARLPGISLIRSSGEGQKVTIRGLSPQYNVMMVNGVRMQSTDRDDRSVDLNSIAPEILSGIEVTKALTADMDADAVGGTVNLKIGKAQQEFYKFSAQGGYASLDNTNPYGNYRFSGLLSNRYFEDKLGVQLSGYIDKYNRNSDELTATYVTDEEEITVGGLIPVYLERVEIYDKVTDRQRVGGNLVFDYQFSNGSLILNSFISSLNQDQIEQQNYFTPGLDWRGYAVDREFTNTVYSSAFQGEFEFFNIGTDFSLSYSGTKQNNPGDLRMDIRPGSGGTVGLSSTVPDLKTLSPSTFLNSVTVLTANKISTGTSTLIRDVNESALSAVLNFNIPFAFSDFLSGNFKLGGKYIHNTRDNDETQLGVDTDRSGPAGPFNDLLKTVWPELGIASDATFLAAGLFNDPNYDVGNFLSGNEGISGNIFYNLVSIEKIHHMEELATQYGYYKPSPLESSQYDYNYTRNFGAFYASAEVKLGKYVSLFPGIRYEKYDYDYTADSTKVFNRNTTTDPNEYYYDNATIHWDSTKSENWFPQIQLRVKPTDWLDVRLASTRSIIYPDYRAVSPYLFVDTYPTIPVLRLGNPYLKPALTQNYDIYVSVYENSIGLFTAGFFYKEIDDLIVPIEYFTNNSALIHYRYILPKAGSKTEVHTWTNLDKTSYVRGIELNWQTHFWYLPSFLSGFVLNINYTHIKSVTYYPYYYTKRTGTPPIFTFTQVDTLRTGKLIDQPNDIMNVTLGYDVGGFSARLTFSYTDNVLRLADPTYEELDSYTAAYYRWDFTAYQNLPWVDGLQLFLNLTNIGNRPDREYTSVLEKLSSVQYYGRAADLGIRYTY